MNIPALLDKVLMGQKLAGAGLNYRPQRPGPSQAPMQAQTASMPGRGLAYKPMSPLASAAGGGLKGLSQLLLALGSGQPEMAGQAFSAGVQGFSAEQQNKADRARQDEIYGLELEDRYDARADKQADRDATAEAKRASDAAIDRLVQSGALDQAEGDAMKAGVGGLGDYMEKPKEEKQPFTGAIKDESGNWVYDPDYLSGQETLRKAGKSTTTITNTLTGPESKADAAQRGKLNEAEGDRWSKLQGAGNVAASTMGEFEVLDELIGEVPSGPWSGRLAEAFPEFSDPAAAFQSVVTRVAPTLRVEGSGATSDIEYDGMLRSLPRLRNQPGANRVISATMKAKAAINIDRASIVTAYQNEEIDIKTARQQMADLDKRSIMTPELRSALDSVKSGGDAKAGDLQDVPGMPGVKYKVLP
jgi:hypothetical protein